MKLLAQPVVEWLGTTPSGWSQPRLKGVFRDSTGSISIEQLAELEVQHYSIPNFDEFGAPAREDGATIASNKTLLRGGEILFSKLNCHKPRVWLVPHDDQVKVASTEFIPLAEWHSGKTDKRFVTYLVGSAVFAEYMTCFQTSVTNSHRRINPNDLWQTRVPLPPLPEQQRIAAYLDASCAAIDAAVAAKRRQLETLDKLASSILLHSLTIGLRQDVETRTTGASVLPQIPAGWRFGRLKSVAAIRYGLGQPPAELSSGVAMIRATDVDAGTIRTDKLLRVDPDELPPDRNPYLKAGEIIVVRSGAYTGDSAIVPAELEGTVAGYDMVVTVTRASARFIAYCLLSRYVLEGQLLLLTLRAAQPHLNAEELGSVLLALPPTRKEQEAIADHLDVKLAEVKLIATGIENQIATLTAYRKSLIHECVTGQRRITEADVNRVKAHG
jgi:type I restriction enzyme S subunit